jgi:hypothetical protein
MCTENAIAESKNRPVNKQRYKLWELDARWLCSVLGTCLTMQELRKAQRQAAMEFEYPPSDHHLHATMVQEAESNNRLSRCLQKLLDRKYQRWINQWAKYKTPAEFDSGWKKAKETGDIPGNFWALLTQPGTRVKLIREANGDVHMLSHLQGASNRADIKRLKSQEREIKALKKELASQRTTSREKIIDLEARLRLQDQQLQSKANAVAQLQQQFSSISKQLDLDKEQQGIAKRLDWMEQRLAQKEVAQLELEQQNYALKEQLKELSLQRQHIGMPRKRAQESIGSMPALNGKQVLYIGGRSTLLPHLRQLVETRQGRFDHHDGGKEDSRAELNGVLAKADMVFCPIDCISHDACLRAKSHCKKYQKPFIPLRSSGVSSFCRELGQFNNN